MTEALTIHGILLWRFQKKNPIFAVFAKAEIAATKMLF